jgi:ATP-dependent exoDNAse (exonuclease V) beta subunit
MSCLDRLGLSKAQAEALADPSPRVLVAAGAGSGKTRLLVAYFVKAVVEDELPVDRLAAVTFTRKAGNELASRIRATLSDCGRSDLARSLDSATIGTIHGLCRRLLREDPLRAGVDPAFSVMEADAAMIAKEEVSRAAWAEAVERADEAQLEVMAARGDDLRRQMFALYDRLRGLGHPHPQVIVRPAGVGPSTSGETRARLLDRAGAALAAAQREGPVSSGLQKDLDRVASCIDFFLRDHQGREEEALRVSCGHFPSRTYKSMEPWFEPMRQALTEHRRALAEVRLRPLVDAVNLLLQVFDRRYTAFKEERGLLDFADLELRARALLERCTESGAAPAAFAGSWVLVDEFQDTNELQCAILEGLAPERLIMVGDERQSIYRFRGADVEVFRRRQRAMPDGVHRLDVNYRSRPEILTFINRLFSQPDFFGEEMRQLQPDRGGRRAATAPGSSDEAAPAAERPAAPAVEVLVAERPACPEEDAPIAPMQAAEAQLVGERVRRLIDEEEWDPRDIVVLLPAVTQVALYQQALVDRGIEVYVVRGKGYYSQDEIYDLGALLRLVVNPHDDLALVTVLRSPLVGMSDDGLYLIGRAARKPGAMSLWEVVREGSVPALEPADQEALGGFLQKLAVLRRRLGRPGLSWLIEEAVSACDYDLYLLSGDQGKRRFANVRKLMRMADDFESLQGPDLAGFVELLQLMEDLGDEEGNAPSLAEGENVVRVMSVHQAKGLEFPVVVLAGLGSDVPGDRAGEFMVADDGRMGVFLKDSGRDNYENGDLAWGPALEILAEARKRSYEEDVRLLYVAMTRAMERLILVGARPGRGGSESRRIGRIVAALGLGALPAAGETLVVPGVDALVTAVAPSGPELASALAEGAPSPKSVPAPVAPCFLDTSQPGAGVRQVSFSALAAYARCPRRFHLERVLGLSALFEPADEDGRQPPDPEAVVDELESGSGREVGLLVHALLERADLTSPAPRPEELRPLAQVAAVASGVGLSGEAMERALRLAAGFWRSPTWAGVARAAPGTALREVPFMFPQGEVLVTGLMDLVWEEEGVRRIADYKSNALGARTPAQAAEAYHLQADVYCLAALRAGASRVQMDLVFLERPEQPVVFACGTSDGARLEALLEAALEGLRRGRFPGLRGEACRVCPVSEPCAAMAWA